MDIEREMMDWATEHMRLRLAQHTDSEPLTLDVTGRDDDMAKVALL